MQLVTRVSLISLAVSAVAATQAITFTNIIITAPPLSNGASSLVIANAIKIFTPNAVVGDPTDPMRAGTLNIQYDAHTGAGPIANAVGANTAVAVLGTGTVVFNELVFELDGLGNEIGGPIGSLSHTFNTSTSNFHAAFIPLSRNVANLRVKKSFTLLAPNSNDLDLAAVTIINQNVQVVPEPASLTALGLGAVALIRRRRAR